MLPRNFCCIYDNSSTFRLFNIAISLFLHLVSFLSFQEIIQIQNLLKVWFYLPLESHSLANLELLRIKQISGCCVARHGSDCNYDISTELRANRLTSLD